MVDPRLHAGEGDVCLAGELFEEGELDLGESSVVEGVEEGVIASTLACAVEHASGGGFGEVEESEGEGVEGGEAGAGVEALLEEAEELVLAVAAEGAAAVAETDEGVVEGEGSLGLGGLGEAGVGGGGRGQIGGQPVWLGMGVVVAGEASTLEEEGSESGAGGFGGIEEGRDVFGGLHEDELEAVVFGEVPGSLGVGEGEGVVEVEGGGGGHAEGETGPVGVGGARMGRVGT
jgi:hypothetical protein